ncbi:hypothetical protein Lal_00011301, partial [Lupinus albus]
MKRSIHSPNIIEVQWNPPSLGRVKINSDGAAHGAPGESSGGDIFRDHLDNFLGERETFVLINFPTMEFHLGAFLGGTKFLTLFFQNFLETRRETIVMINLPIMEFHLGAFLGGMKFLTLFFQNFLEIGYDFLFVDFPR